MAQQNIWGDYEPEYTPSIREWMKRMDTESSRDRQKLFVFHHPATPAFLHAALKIAELNPMLGRFGKWLFEDLPPLESVCRGSRPSAIEGGTNDRPKRSIPGIQATWYSDYLKTPHMRVIKTRAVAYYGGCVLCGSDVDMEIHHRHYNTLGNEQMRDVSILCHAHHKPAHEMLGVRIPRIMPEEVARHLER